MQIVLVPRHLQHLRNNGISGPFGAELFDQFLQVLSGCLSDGEHCGWATMDMSWGDAYQWVIPWSTSQVMHKVLSFSSKNSTPSCPASSGMYWMMANRTRHLLSSANSTIAGNKDWLNCWIPITSLTQSKFDMMLSLTSGHSSFSCDKNMGNKCSIVLFLPKIGDNPIMTEARADFTCWFGSLTRSLTPGWNGRPLDGQRGQWMRNYMAICGSWWAAPETRPDSSSDRSP